MLRNSQLVRYTKIIIKLVLTLLLFSVTQCAFLPEQKSQIDFDLSDNSQDFFNLTFVADPKNENAEQFSQFLQIIEDDLTRSGRFKVNIQSDATNRGVTASQIKYDLVSRGSIVSKDDDFLIDFELSLADHSQKLNSFQSVATSSELRQVAHRVSDNIFQTMLGVRGPFSTKLCFVTVHGKLKHRLYGLWMTDADGYNKTPLFSSPEPIMSPSWSPNGKQIAFIAFKKRDRQGLFIYSLATNSVRELKVWDKGLVGAPSWSPNSEYMAFTFIKDGNADIYALDLHSNTEIRLTDDKAIDTEAVWMPDSKSLIFTSDRAGAPQLYEVKLDSKELSRVTYNGQENAQANVSPMAKNIAMIHKINNHYHIALYNRYSKKIKVLTKGMEDESPSFSPGGSMILYTAVEDQRTSLNIVSSNGKINKVLAKFDDVRQPSWSPLL